MISFEKMIIKSGRLGEGCVIPDIHATAADPFFIKEETVTDADELAIGEGMIKTILPYKMQNGYSRELFDVEYNVAVLENERLKAVFIPELGGRLWSLFDKKTGKDVIYENDAVRFANLAIRNAWFAGGVEWNIGIKGHSTLTCEPMFAQKVQTAFGEALKMYAYEEIRGVVYSLTATLKDDELLVKIDIENPNDKDTYMYWWSNIAVEQTPDCRVVVPAYKSFITSYRDGGYRISKKDVPILNGKDVSFPKNAYDAIDYFYDVPKDRKKWIAWLDGDGSGLLQFSSKNLIGRKCFLWGNLPGGQHWNRWLTGGRDYLEIQAGLLKTQFEHFLMPAGAHISWCEVYKPVQVKQTNAPYADVEKGLDDMVFELTDYEKGLTPISQGEIEQFGTPHGALEELIRGKKLSSTCSFPKESITAEYAYYADLAAGKTGENYQISYLKNPAWGKLIEQKQEKTALDYYLHAINAFINGEKDKAYALLENSVALCPSYYAYISLALIDAYVNGNPASSLAWAKKAAELGCGDVSIMRTVGEICLSANAPETFIEYYDNAPEKLKNDGRIQMYYGKCLILCDRLSEAQKYINKDLVVDDIREGEYSASNIWIELYKKILAQKLEKPAQEISNADVLKEYPVPYEIDFRMH